MASFYTETVPSRSALLIPKVKNMALHSMYSPEREAESFADNYGDNLLFFIAG